ncbi:MAG: cell division protein ZapA [candidate division WOR-3 bacterium]
MKIEFNLFGTNYSFTMKIENEEELSKLKEIISDICNYVENNYKNLARDKKVALVILLLAHKVLQREKRIDRLNQILKDYEAALNFVEKMDES